SLTAVLNLALREVSLNESVALNINRGNKLHIHAYLAVLTFRRLCELLNHLLGVLNARINSLLNRSGGEGVRVGLVIGRDAGERVQEDGCLLVGSKGMIALRLE